MAKNKTWLILLDPTLQLWQYDLVVPLAPPKLCAPGTTKVLCPWHRKSSVSLALQEFCAPGTTKMFMYVLTM